MESKAQYSLRPATLEDLPMILGIEKEVQPTSAWSADHFRSELEKPYSRFLVLTDDETDSVIIGYIVGWMLFDECQILNIAVSLAYQRRGYGKAMIHKIVTLAGQNGIQKLSLDVRISNHSAIQLYQKMGFSITSIRKRFYSDGEDAYQMGLIPGDPIDF